MANLKGVRQFIERYYTWVALTTLKPTQILLADPGEFRDLLLRETLFLAYAGKVSTNERTHIHA